MPGPNTLPYVPPNNLARGQRLAGQGVEQYLSEGSSESGSDSMSSVKENVSVKKEVSLYPFVQHYSLT